MSRIYVGQSSLKMQVTTGIDLSEATTCLIKYRKPDGTAGSWTATISDAANGIIYYDLTHEDAFDKPGIWTFWAHITFSDTREAPGAIFKETIIVEGTQ